MFRASHIAWFVIVCAALPTCNVRAQGVLQQMRDDVQQGTGSKDEEEPEKDKKTRHCHPHELDDHYHQSPLKELVGTALLWSITGPFWGPPVMVGDDYSSTTYLSCYPYQHDTSGFVLIAPLPESDDQYTWSLRARGEYADDFDSLTRYSGRILWESRNRLGIDTSLDYRREALPNNRYDDLWTGDANIVFRFAQSDTLMMHTGLGLNYLTEDYGTDLGFNFTYSADCSLSNRG